MIRIYRNDCENFDNNGLGILSDFKTTPKIKESLNGRFELNFDYAIDGKNSEYLVIDNIIKAPYDTSEQLFRIKKVKPTLNKLNVYATHIFYDLSENFLIDVAPTRKTAVNAIEWLLNNAMFSTRFNVLGDSTEDASARYIRKNIVDAILGSDNCIVKRWGGEIERDNFNIIYHNVRGKNRGVYIKYGKNIKEIELSVDFSTVVTRVVPQGANELILPEIYVDSPLINTYRNPIVKKYEFPSIAVDENTTEEQAYEELRDAANELFNNDKIDKPKITVKVNWLELSKTEEYKKKYSNFEYVRLGDTVTVDALGYKYEIRVITVEYDCILKRYTSFEIGEPKADYVNSQAEVIASEIQKSSSSILQQAKQTAAALINNGFGGHVRIYPDRILIMDTDDETTAQNVWQWNLNGFGHSSNGVNGNYKTAMTIDGGIVADFITSGTMSAQRIKGGTLKLGGEDNSNGQAEVADSEGNIIGKIDNTGMYIKYENNLRDITTLIQFINSKIIQTTNKTSGVGIVQFNSVISNPGYELQIRNACQLFPSPNPYPSSTLYPLGRWLRITYSDNTYTRYKLPILALRELNGVYDELWIKSGKVSITKRIGMTANEELYLLDNPVTTTYDDIILDIRQGINQISLESFPGALLQIEYMIESIFTDTFSTQLQTKAEIDIASDSILAEVSKKAGTAYVDAQIELTAGQITESVSQSEQLIWDEMENKANTDYVDTEVSNTASDLTSEINKSNTAINNNYQEIINKFNGYTPTSRTVELETSINRIQTNTYTREEVNTKLTDGSVTKVQTTSGTFDENGMTYEKTNAPTKTTINEVGVDTKRTSTNESILFAGYVDDNNTQYADYRGQTIVATDNIIVKRYLTIGSHSRLEDYQDGTGIFV